MGRKVGLPPRLITLIQGEGLLNDATALTILSVAVAAAQGDGFSTPAALGQFVVAAAGGVATGVAVAFGVRPLRRLRRDPLSSNAISLATPFVAYLVAESVHVSGVLAVVVAGLIIGHNNPYWASGASRLQTARCGGWSTSCSKDWCSSSSGSSCRPSSRASARTPPPPSGPPH